MGATAFIQSFQKRFYFQRPMLSSLRFNRFILNNSCKFGVSFGSFYIHFERIQLLSEVLYHLDGDTFMKQVTGSQIRMARAHLKWSIKKLALEAGIGTTTIQRMEKDNAVPDVKTSLLHKVGMILTAELAKHDAEFIQDADEYAGIRHKIPSV